MNGQVIQLIGGMVSAGIGGVIVWLANKNKTNAETEAIASQTYRNLNQDLLLQRQQQKDEFSRQLDNERQDFIVQLETLKNKYEQQIAQIISDNTKSVEEKNKRIKDLEDRVDILEAELERYHQIENKVVEAVNISKT